MKRKIMFKARCNEHVVIDGIDYYGRWVYGEYGHFHESATKMGKAYIGDAMKLYCFTIDDTTLCQFTGQQSACFQDIYDGDILKSEYYPFHDGEHFEKDMVAVVVWMEHYSKFKLLVYSKEPGAKESYNAVQSEDMSDTFLEMYDMHVCGNVYDDDELSQRLKKLIAY